MVCGTQITWTNTLTTITLSQVDGTEIEFIDQLTGGQPLNGQFSSAGGSRGSTFITHDGSGAILQTAAAIQDVSGSCTNQGGPFPVSGTVTFRDGTTHTFVNGSLTQIRDRNGNTAALAYNQCTGTTTIADSLGRTTTITAGLITYSGVGGVARHVTFGSDPTLGGLRADQEALFNQYIAQGEGYNCGTSAQPALCAAVLYPMLGIAQAATINGNAGTITLPSNTAAYTLQNDIYGNLARIILPTGGAYEYDYDHVMACGLSASSNCSYYGAAYLKEKRIYADAGADRTTGWVQRTTFASYYSNGQVYDGRNPPTALTPIVTVVKYFTPDSTPTGALSGEEKHTFFLGSSQGTALTPWKNGKESLTQIYNTDAQTLLKTTTQTWDQRPCASNDRIPCAWYAGTLESDPTLAHDPVLTQEIETYGSETSKRTYGYDSYSNQTSVAEYGFGAGAAGALVRTTTTSFDTDSVFPNSSSYLALNILGLPWTETVTDGNGSMVTQTTWTYDSSSLTDRSNITGHDPSYGTSFTYRGNPTSIATGIQPDGPLMSYRQYDIAGNTVKVLDPRGACTQWGYADAGNTFAFPTSVTSYTGLNCTGTAMTASAIYDYNIAKPASSTDVNNNTTSFDYTDPLDRLKLITRPPGGGSTAFTYTDTVGALSATTAVAQSSGTPITTTQNYDGLGRKTRATRTAACASGGDVNADTTYDSRGRVYQVSTPYCPGATPGYTTTLYDGLGRPTSVTAPGGAVTTNTYTTSSLGLVTAVTTPAIVSGAAGTITRQSTTDAQGRLRQVIEDPAGNTYQTTYAYDALDNLTAVSQSGQTRTFLYDSLKRLRQAINPESGQLTYTYDGSGNLSTKLDARSITTTLSYDGMNRILSKSYSSLGNGVSYVYDSTQSGCNGLGRLASVTCGTSTTNYSCYDKLGHVTSSSQTPAGTTYPAFHYTWDLSGALASETYPSGRIVTNTYDAAGRVHLVQGQPTVGASTTNYASNVLYASQGALQNVQLGNGIAETWSFGTPEQQPTQLVASGTNASLTLGWSYGAEDHNNGNIQSATIVRSGVSTTQQFTYDAINRLTAANEVGGWSQGYNYDAFGNLTGGAATGITAAFPGSISATNNRITDPGWRYDLAGNVIQSPAAASVVYDAENRQTSYTTSGSAPATATYAYDGEGRRVRKTEADGATTTYVYDAMGQLAAEYDTGSSTASGTQYLTADNLGSTRLLTDANGAVVACHDYQPFGAEIPSGNNSRGACYAGTDNPKQKFTGKERDAETGLDYFGARYFSGTQGRFTSPDPLPWLGWQRGNSDAQKKFANWIADPQNLNLYAYVDGNPLNRADPTGMYACNGDKQQCQAFKDALAIVQKAASGLKEGSKERKQLDSVLKFYGKDDGKGPGINFGNLGGMGAVGITQTDHGKTTITFDTAALGGMSKVGQGETVAHEGTHGRDDHMPGVGAGLFWKFYDTEYHAYQSESYVDMGLGKASETDKYPSWAPGMSYSDHVKNITRDAYDNAVLDCQNAGCAP